jgi:DNA-binding cell septation regulator SpoVG
MDLKVSRVTFRVSPENDGSKATKAFADVVFNGLLLVSGFTVMSGRHGLFVSMPRKKVGDEYRDSVYPLSKEGREYISFAVLSAYHEWLKGLKEVPF